MYAPNSPARLCGSLPVGMLRDQAGSSMVKLASAKARHTENNSTSNHSMSAKSEMDCEAAAAAEGTAARRAALVGGLCRFGFGLAGLLDLLALREGLLLILTMGLPENLGFGKAE